MIFDWKQTIRTIGAAATTVAGILASVAKCTGDDPLTPIVEAAKCGATWIPPQYLVYVTIIYGATEIILKATKPGGVISSWFGKSVLVVPPEEAKPGVVTPAQVAATK